MVLLYRTFSKNIFTGKARCDCLCVHYRAALGIGFYNAVEKLFMSALGDYVNMCTINRHQYSYLHSTSTGFTQPGAMYVKWSLPAKVTRAKGAKGRSQQRVLTLEERYADFVIYDKINCINPVVAEIKQDV